MYRCKIRATNFNWHVTWQVKLYNQRAKYKGGEVIVGQVVIVTGFKTFIDALAFAIVRLKWHYDR